jgi:hypothetical protein
MEALGNIRRGIHMAVQVLEAGYSPICPWLDHLYVLHVALPVELLQEASMAQLRKADAVLLLDGWEHSNGTQLEVEEAGRLGIKVFRDVGQLMASMPPGGK